jgi:hypothetical protein
MAYQTALKLRHGPGRYITSASHSPLMDFAVSVQQKSSILGGGFVFPTKIPGKTRTMILPGTSVLFFAIRG